MIKCRICRTENIAGSQYCDECGASLQESMDDNNSIDLYPLIPEAPVIKSKNVTSVGSAPINENLPTDDETIVKAKNKKAADAFAKLTIERGQSAGIEFALSADESNIGRWDADNGIFPDVDLDAHDAEAKVSRRHARIVRQNGKFLVEDLGSTNGTFINRGRRLIPGSSSVLTDGDEIIVGKTFLRFHINK
jgi:pSer/pThr/pTyr-binding forkhead associated (FHA) protein